MFISKLGSKQRGGQFAVRGEPLSCQELIAKNGERLGGRVGRRMGRQEKVQVTLFFFLEMNSG